MSSPRSGENPELELVTPRNDVFSFARRKQMVRPHQDDFELQRLVTYAQTRSEKVPLLRVLRVQNVKLSYLALPCPARHFWLRQRGRRRADVQQGALVERCRR